MNTQVNDMLNNNFIRPSTSPWRSPVLLVKKKSEDGTITYRFCTDLKKVNSVTTKHECTKYILAVNGSSFTWIDLATMPCIYR